MTKMTGNSIYSGVAIGGVDHEKKWSKVPLPYNRPWIFIMYTIAEAL